MRLIIFSLATAYCFLSIQKTHRRTIIYNFPVKGTGDFVTNKIDKINSQEESST